MGNPEVVRFEFKPFKLTSDMTGPLSRRPPHYFWQGTQAENLYYSPRPYLYISRGRSPMRRQPSFE